MSEFTEPVVPVEAVVPVEGLVLKETPESSSRFTLIATAVGMAARTGFYAGRATERISSIVRDTRDETQGIVSNSGISQSQSESDVPQRSFSQELIEHAAKAAAVTVGRTVLLGLAQRIDNQPVASRTVRAAAWALRAAGSNIG